MASPADPSTGNLSLVAYYGDKPPAISVLIAESQEILLDTLGDAFRPYDHRQVHATLVSLEGQRSGDTIINDNYRYFYGERRAIDFNSIFDLLRTPGLLPFDVVIGGFDTRRNYAFTSRSIHPGLRSFSIQGDIAVAMGWPLKGDTSPPLLDRLRRTFNRANVLHKYHRTRADVDNDFYFVLGNVAVTEGNAVKWRAACERMTDFLATRAPLAVPVAREHLRIIAYDDSRAPPESTRSYTMDEAEKKLAEIKTLYREEDN